MWWAWVLIAFGLLLVTGGGFVWGYFLGRSDERKTIIRMKLSYKDLEKRDGHV